MFHDLLHLNPYLQALLGTSKGLVWGILLTVVIPWFYPIKTINKTFFLEGNYQTHSDLGTNNLVPHVLVIIWLQATKQVFSASGNSIWRLGNQPSMAKWKTNFTIINITASGDIVQNMGIVVGSADPNIVGLAPPLCLELHHQATCKRWTFGSTKGGSADPPMRPSQPLPDTQDPPNTIPSKFHPWIISVFLLNGKRWSHMDP